MKKAVVFQTALLKWVEPWRLANLFLAALDPDAQGNCTSTEWNIKMPSTIVNKNYSLSYSQSEGPIVSSLSGQKTKLPDNEFGRWYARVHFQQMHATNEGKKWFLEANPANLEKIFNLTHKPKLFQTDFYHPRLLPFTAPKGSRKCFPNCMPCKRFRYLGRWDRKAH